MSTARNIKGCPGAGGSAIADKLQGKFIVFDGLDGCGKSTQLYMLEQCLGDKLPMLKTRDPGGTPVGECIREIILSGKYGQLSLTCELLLFMASRAQMVHELISPALGEGKTVLCDRFLSATCAYQGAGGADVHDILALSDVTVGACWPDLTVIIDVPVEVGLARLGDLFVGQGLDAMESRPMEFHQQVRKIFLQLPGLYPRPVVIIDGQDKLEAVHEAILRTIKMTDF